MDHADQAGGSYTDADIPERVPMGRFASPEDIARAIAFLSDEWKLAIAAVTASLRWPAVSESGYAEVRQETNPVMLLALFLYFSRFKCAWKIYATNSNLWRFFDLGTHPRKPE
jgi:hypothetical protein